MRLAVCQDLQLLSIRVCFFFNYYYFIIIIITLWLHSRCCVMCLHSGRLLLNPSYFIISKPKVSAVLRLIFLFAFVFLQHCHPEVHGAEAFLLLAWSLVPCRTEAAGPGQWVHGLAAYKPPNARLQNLYVEGESCRLIMTCNLQVASRWLFHVTWLPLINLIAV